MGLNNKSGSIAAVPGNAPPAPTRLAPKKPHLAFPSWIERMSTFRPATGSRWNSSPGFRREFTHSSGRCIQVPPRFGGDSPKSSGNTIRIATAIHPGHGEFLVEHLQVRLHGHLVRAANESGGDPKADEKGSQKHLNENNRVVLQEYQYILRIYSGNMFVHVGFRYDNPD